MSISIVSFGRNTNDVALLYDAVLVFADAVTGARHISEQAERNRVPFATLAVPAELDRYLLLSVLRAYQNAYDDIFADKFVVNRFGEVLGVQWDDTNPALPAQNFWRAVASLYRLNGHGLLQR